MTLGEWEPAKKMFDSMKESFIVLLDFSTFGITASYCGHTPSQQG